MCIRDRSNRAKISGSPGYIAPEILSRCRFNEKVDVYSCGITLYYMLAGELPFIASKTANLLRLNKRNKISFMRCPWISKEAQGFIRSLTHTNPADRPTVDEALTSPWLRRGTKAEKTIAQEIAKKRFSENCFGCYNALAKTVQSEYSTSLVNDSLEISTMKELDEEGKVNRPLPSRELHEFLINRKEGTRRKGSLVELSKSRKDDLTALSDGIKHSDPSSFVLFSNNVHILR
eukprot:TRINITY_DN9722_c0_g1_i7.p1 TRINITY_DN9722_c0_g1~~TRINITY_DN9722_c0_g1_i7.p1  ORF type:complete len:233 (-),score=44.71 TRINITY_DN9722_c0_g1_i7:265-963(-)